MLRRLRWRQERMAAVETVDRKKQNVVMNSGIASDMLNFLSEDHKQTFTDSIDLQSLIEAMKVQQERAEVSFFFIIQRLTTK